MDLFIHQVIAGFATGGIYACMALAVVMIYQAIHHLNFAQGEMAMFSTYLGWQLLAWGAPYWAVFPLVMAISFAGGLAIERIVVRPIENAPVLSHVVIFIALFAIFNSAAGFIWGFTIKPVPSPFGEGALYPGAPIGKHQAGMLVVTMIVLSLLWAFFRFTRVGLSMRAASVNPESARLVGVRVSLMNGLGWGMASAIGALAGLLIAPVVFLEPNMMLSILLYGFAGAVLGGLSSPLGAVLGGFIVGIVENLAGTYIPVIGGELKLSIALFLIVAVLLVKPAGLLGRRTVQRV
ncbi:amino acid/amide ABC transporter membrane protein 1 (HAAT family) [Roseiarcus fermentans]|uniref:Amino acid/amide ABC transporter membrane protein 1 (HAAT family) n=1 Tax=Roseiarcus fermentans TaxID=1473586 RepID=A0A366F5H1_9HYPH|nr:branched-chain amino acid ABC transporter permease [Roseiarcus fermentans]RBP09891.1 amino acid/amide ABC transporter membrane protein 1 (HAAT family) [Roseiarcus fermentans]